MGLRVVKFRVESQLVALVMPDRPTPEMILLEALAIPELDARVM